MANLSIIIPSRNVTNLTACIGAIRSSGEAARIIVVDDGVDRGCSNFQYFINYTDFDPNAPKCGSGIFFTDEKLKQVALGPQRRGLDLVEGPVGDIFYWVKGIKPFVFARNVNLGIQIAGTDDVLILNDDGLLRTPNGFSDLHMLSQSHPDFGIISSACNNVGNMNMHRCPPVMIPVDRRPPGQFAEWRLREDPRMVCFVACLIPRSTIELIGGLDERFTNYGMDDDDYSYRVRLAGLKIGIWDGCFVDHHQLQSTYRTPSPNNSSPGDFKPNLAIYIRKWGVDNRGMSRNQSPWQALFPVGRWECEWCAGTGAGEFAHYGSNDRLRCKICSGKGYFE